jgi:hypothetical protein
MIEMHAQLVGAVPKKGSGTLDGGQTWAHDHVELFVLTPLKGDGIGHATTPYRIQGCDANIASAKSLVGSDIVLTLEVETNGKSGLPTLAPTGFRAHSAKKQA